MFDFCIRLFCPRPPGPGPPGPAWPLLPPSPRARARHGARASPRSGSAPNGSVCDPWTVRRGTGRAMGCRACPFPSRVARSAARPAQRARTARARAQQPGPQSHGAPVECLEKMKTGGEARLGNGNRPSAGCQPWRHAWRWGSLARRACVADSEGIAHRLIRPERRGGRHPSLLWHSAETRNLYSRSVREQSAQGGALRGANADTRYPRGGPVVANPLTPTLQSAQTGHPAPTRPRVRARRGSL